MKKKTGQTSQYKGIKIGRIMKNLDISFSEALYVHIQDKKYMENKNVSKQKA